MSGFTKLDASIIHSTVWREPDPIRIVWVTMMAMADARGFVGSSLPGLADAARVSIEDCVEAIKRFEQPDEYSRTPDYDGRRIETVSGGWWLLNHGKYREKRDPEERRRQNREAQARWRNKQNVSQDKPQSAQAEAEAEAEAEEQNMSAPADRGPRLEQDCDVVFERWIPLWRMVDPKQRANKRPQKTDKRMKPIRARLRGGNTVDQLCTVIAHVEQQPFYLGQNDRGRTYIEPETIFRDAGKVDGHIAWRPPSERGLVPRQPNHGMTGAEKARILEA